MVPLAINRGELEQLIDNAGLGSRSRQKLLTALEGPREQPKARGRKSKGHGAPAPDRRPVPTI
ncbi:MAG TPA: hypothetical protein DDW41_04840 [Candidatus Andersenbacteria bacterium]|nr:hypothetical protein [Candidatus Andersenbacteria bacterium]